MLHFYATGITHAMALKKVGKGSQYAFAYLDSNGNVVISSYRSVQIFYAAVFSISTNILGQHSIKTNPTWFLSKQNALY